MANEDKGWFHKYNITRTDGKDKPGEKHENCELFVLDLDHDPFALNALLTYASVCAKTQPDLARDILDKVQAREGR